MRPALAFFGSRLLPRFARRLRRAAIAALILIRLDATCFKEMDPKEMDIADIDFEHPCLITRFRS